MKTKIYLISVLLVTILLLLTIKTVKKEDNIILSENIIICVDTSIISNKLYNISVNCIKQKKIRNIFNKHGIQELTSVFKNRYDINGKLKSNIVCNEEHVWVICKTDNNEISNRIIRALKNNDGIIHAYIEKPLILKPCVFPDDPEYSLQWHLKSTSNPNADIDIEQAWNINKGRNDVIVAVCDGGVDYTHPDLDPGDRSRVITGYDSGSNDNDPMDDLPISADSYGNHGTHIAGIIGAIPNNNNKVAGIMWNCKIMPVKMVGREAKIFGGTIYDFSNIAFPSDVADAIDYAVNNGANVINLSYGFDGKGLFYNRIIARIPLLYSSIKRAYNQNVVLVGAIGNEYNNGNPIEYPAAFKEVIAVGATENTTPVTRISFSNTGSHISVSAPGNEILSTTRGNTTGKKSGTSMAAPVVSGVAGLIISQAKDRGFNVTNDDVKHIMEITADDVVQYGVGFDNQTGYGKVNAYKALSLLKSPHTVVHASATGGNFTKISTINKWIYQSSRWGLSAGAYLNVDQYEVRKHVVFPKPFTDIPQLWMRERTSACLSYANPNSGYPYCQISNVTTTGFDVKYVVYYVKNNTLGQQINKWIPEHPNYAHVDYTAVGILAPIITGPTTVCNTSTTFTLHNRPAGTNVTWSHSNNLTYVSGQGTNNYRVKAEPNSSSEGWIQANINGNHIRSDVWVGTISLSVCDLEFTNNYNGEDVLCSNAAGNKFNFYNTNHNYMIDKYEIEIRDIDTYQLIDSYITSSGSGSMDYPGYRKQFLLFTAKASNQCGYGDLFETEVQYMECNDDNIEFSIYPNPANTTVIFTLTSSGMVKNNTKALKPYDIQIWNAHQMLKSIKTSANSTEIPVSSLKAGYYYVVANKDGKTTKQQFFKQ